MKIKNLLWIVALILLIIIVSTKQPQKETIGDGIYRNCYMIRLIHDQMEVMIGDQSWTIDCPTGETEEKTDKIVDIEVENGQIKKITWKEGTVEDKSLAVNQEEGWIRLESQGKISLSSYLKIYIKDEEGVRLMSNPGSLLNWDKVLVYIHDEKVEAVVANGEQNKQVIKVLLHGNINDIYHKEVRLTASESYKVTSGDETKTYEAGQEFQLSEESGFYHITCEEGKIRMLSSTHISGYPEYRGDIYIERSEKGYIVRNELPLEEYLYSVVSSEMPSSYPEEALKAQAVCARTYALYQMEQAYYSAYGAHVDDTVNSQVYNNVAETKQSRNAVNETKGQYLQYENQTIPAYFYSTSSGHTSDVNDVWVKGGESPVYLRGHLQAACQEELDLSQEEDFAAFIKEENECFEKEEDWFRWKATITVENLTKHMNENVKDGNIGTITNVEVTERSKGGVLKQIRITGEKGEVTVTGEYQIRKVLCPENTKLVLQNEESRTVDMLPSGYFYIAMKKKSVVIAGGGYGHGVGLSQNGAKAMALLDHGFEDILLFYYPETTLFEKY